ncbi:hypothetical protein HPP92_023914 [Vanilla planifolia]|uniref:DUF7733 domain-containing protein n=1 Tax=Vanilla planifolia TaxID=51239 RepID=A0A835U9T5_VANPL|nr:hypothetical protein HPP92_024311 [Vanilla planifolia]KAG0456126.1 hypothetical protein HPP92_023914 [Vanilla planifolia]
MSGLSLAAAPSSDASVEPAQAAKTPGVMGGVMGSLRVIELQLVAFIMVFSASGLVPVLDLVFPGCATLYCLALSRLVFPSLHSGPNREIFRGSRWFQAYVVIGTTVGLFLPLAYVLGGFARGDDSSVRSATPHLFLLSCQILTENLISGFSLFSQPVRAMVPLMYTVRRIFVIVDWMYDLWINKKVSAFASFSDLSWIWFGRALAAANFVYFGANLFGFLIPRFLPRAFEMYFKERDEICSKRAEDKRAGEVAEAGVKKSTETKKVE